MRGSTVHRFHCTAKKVFEAVHALALKQVASRQCLEVNEASDVGDPDGEEPEHRPAPLRSMDWMDNRTVLKNRTGYQ